MSFSMTALCFMSHGPRRVPVTMTDGRLLASCPECPRVFVVVAEQVTMTRDDGEVSP
jgi:hypothetical protein